MKNNRKNIFTFIYISIFLKLARLIIGLIIWGWILYSGIRIFFPVDISQDYRKVQGIENVILRSRWGDKDHNGQCYKRVFWGLQRIEDTQTDYSEICWESDGSKHELLDCIDTDNSIWRSVYSPDKKYILYCEIEHKSGVTDDEYCYYRVYEIETGKIITIYQAYKEWYNLAWLD